MARPYRRATAWARHGRVPDGMHADLLVIGGGPAALAAATAYRDHGGEGSVVLASADSAAPYARPPLSKDFLRGESEAADAELTSAMTYTERGLTLLLRREVTALDPAARTAGDVTFTTCVLATGARPLRIPVPGADDPAVLTLRSLEDAQRLRSAALGARTAVVVGSGFIGCEAAVSLARRGLTVTVVATEELPQLARLGPEVGERLAAWLEEDGVALRGGASVEEIVGGRRVRLGDGTTLDTDLVLMATGVEPAADLAERAGLAVENGRVVVDAHMRTSVPHVLAAGDVAFAENRAAGRHLAVEHWGEAEGMGAIAGATAAGADAVWDTVPGFWSVIGDHTLQYKAWGDGYDRAHLVDHGDGAFTVWYADDRGRTVGVAAHGADEDYERGDALIRAGAPVPTAVRR
ncbi:NAD(P)/FAD-dependent oxidoreductase [Pseudonocardia xishanensis]|uniref:FAD-dependent oxidoreductase n=1 Tax=Pseudonocardia xishanensis TaxID=630995 RepID=A0ABP8RYR6_9PSEU